VPPRRKRTNERKTYPCIELIDFSKRSSFASFRKFRKLQPHNSFPDLYRNNIKRIFTFSKSWQGRRQRIWIHRSFWYQHNIRYIIDTTRYFIRKQDDFQSECLVRIPQSGIEFHLPRTSFTLEHESGDILIRPDGFFETRTNGLRNAVHFCGTFSFLDLQQ
jgi:hypothetical protein